MALPALSSSLLAQQGSLNGRILDHNQSAIPEATVSATARDTDLKTSTRSNESGSYTLSLPPGLYDVAVQATGFETQRQNGLRLDVAQQAQVDFTLEPGTMAQVLTVSAGSQLLQVTGGDVSTVVDRALTDNLPLNGRSFQNLITIAPGVNLSNSQNSNGQFVVNGLRASANSFTVDGVSAISTVTGYQSAGGNNASYNVAGGTNSMVPVDALEEFRILTSSYAPEYGRAPGAQILLVTRSGANTFHGTAFDYFRNDKLDAADWFVDQSGQRKPALRSNDFGGVLGGPLVRNTLFFFVSWEAQRLVQPQFTITTVPSLAARQSAPLVAQPFLNAFPVPNGPDLENNQAQFSSGYSNPLSTNSTLAKLDQAFGSNIRAFGIFVWAPSGKTSRSNSGSASLADSVVARIAQRSLTTGFTYIASANATNDLRINLSSSQNAQHFTMDTFGGATIPANALLLPGTSPESNYSFVTLGDPGGDLFGGNIGTSEQRQINIVNSTNFAYRAHQLKWGADYRLLLPLIIAGGDQFFQFTGVSGLVNNHLDAFHSTAPSRARTGIANLSLYAQDTWRIAPHLNATYGVRWDFTSVPHSRDANNGNLVPLVGNYATGNVAAGSAGASLWQTRHANFAPRVGLAWQIASKTVFRTGGGLFYDTGIAEASSQPWVSGYPSGQATVLLNSSLPVDPAQVRLPAVNLSQPPPGNQFFMFPSDFHAPRVWEWNAALQQALGNNDTLTLTYAGSAGRKLIYPVSYPVVTANIYSVTYTDNGGSSDYNSFQLQYERRLQKNLAASLSYTWSHSIDTNSSDTLTSVPGVFETPGSNRGDSDFDIRHSFHGGFSFSIPAVGRTPVMKAITAGWGVDGIATAQTALPLNVTFKHNIGFGSYALRPDLMPGVAVWIANPNVAGSRQLNPAALVAPMEAVQGNLGRNALRGFALAQADLSVRRSFPVTDKLNLLFRADFFNALNHPNFANPVPTIGSGLFGISTATVANSQTGGGAFGLNSLFNIGGPRAVQLSLRLQF